MKFLSYTKPVIEISREKKLMREYTEKYLMRKQAEKYFLRIINAETSRKIKFGKINSETYKNLNLIMITLLYSSSLRSSS
jgi:hypothetical protein